MADPSRFNADPDPKVFLARRENFLFKIFNLFFQNLTKLVMCNFLNNNAGGEREGGGIGCEG